MLQWTGINFVKDKHNICAHSIIQNTPILLYNTKINNNNNQRTFYILALQYVYYSRISVFKILYGQK